MQRFTIAGAPLLIFPVQISLFLLLKNFSNFLFFCVYFFEFDGSLLFGGFFLFCPIPDAHLLAFFSCTDFFIFAAEKFLYFFIFVFTFLNLMTLYYLEGFFFSVGHPRHISPKKKQIHRESDGLNRSGDSSVAKAFKAHSEQGIIFNLFSAFIGLQFYRTTK